MTHGFGELPCGAAPCGLGAAVQTPPRRRSVPQALAFDGPRRNFVIDERGQYKGAHPVDAKVFLLLRTVQGSIRSAPDVGQTVGAITHIDQQTIQADVEDRVRRVLAPVVAAGEILVRSVVVDTSTPGAIFFAVNYVNRITAKPETYRSH